ncbi:MAG: hypothetical protein M1838_004998 [Thelocarpon superellum]|nr:MAG: hypothetical protein M1838_004998 [Thelocarpon superellum]
MPVTDPTKLHPHLFLQLADTSALTLVSSDVASTQHDAVTRSMTRNFLSTHDIASSLGLGVPLRITCLTQSGILLSQSYVPEPSLEEEAPTDVGSNARLEAGTREVAINGSREREGVPPPALVATVVGPEANRRAEARQTIQELEDLAHTFHTAWIREQGVNRDGVGDHESEA